MNPTTSKKKNVLNGSCIWVYPTLRRKLGVHTQKNQAVAWTISRRKLHITPPHTHTHTHAHAHAHAHEHTRTHTTHRQRAKMGFQDLHCAGSCWPEAVDWQSHSPPSRGGTNAESHTSTSSTSHQPPFRPTEFNLWWCFGHWCLKSQFLMVWVTHSVLLWKQILQPNRARDPRPDTFVVTQKQGRRRVGDLC